ncbi:hypothetical protein [Streptomyces apocyni]|uniref:hypothetical protein n=1 Tax=Streptomyces apocyni TaxID=2654677 RepID=UPI0012EAB69A|nr:hypothetical protein [Streptomyces apocyni]
MAWDEWEQLKAEAADKHAAQRMQVNATPPSPGGAGPGYTGHLASSPAEMKAAIKAIDGYISGGVGKAGTTADEETKAAVTEFRKHGEGWDTATGLNDALKTWSEQVKALRKRLAADSYALHKAAGILKGTDVGVGLRSSQIANL